MRLHEWMFETASWRTRQGLRGASATPTRMSLAQARTATGDKDVAIAGGVSTVRQYLAAGLRDELYLHIVPVLLGAGERLLDNVGDPVLEPVKVVASPRRVTQVKYRVVRPATDAAFPRG